MKQLLTSLNMGQVTLKVRTAEVCQPAFVLAFVILPAHCTHVFIFSAGGPDSRRSDRTRKYPTTQAGALG